jgi:hypothetical protein
MWYVLKERTFDEAALRDLLHLKEGLALGSEDVAAALLERCKRIEQKYGNLVLPETGTPLKHTTS